MISFLFQLFISTLLACPSGQVEVREAARLEYLDHGATVQFNERIDIPAFESEVKLAGQVYYYLEPSARDRFIPKGRAFKIEKSDTHFFVLESGEIFFGLRVGLPVLGNLSRESNQKFTVCRNLSSSIAI